MSVLNMLNNSKINISKGEVELYFDDKSSKKYNREGGAALQDLIPEGKKLAGMRIGPKTSIKLCTNSICSGTPVILTNKLNSDVDNIIYQVHGVKLDYSGKLLDRTKIESDLEESKSLKKWFSEKIPTLVFRDSIEKFSQLERCKCGNSEGECRCKKAGVNKCKKIISTLKDNKDTVCLLLILTVLAYALAKKHNLSVDRVLDMLKK